jgi:hypothetical protein
VRQPSDAGKDASRKADADVGPAASPADAGAAEDGELSADGTSDDAATAPQLAAARQHLERFLQPRDALDLAATAAAYADSWSAAIGGSYDSRQNPYIADSFRGVMVPGGRDAELLEPAEGSGSTVRIEGSMSGAKERDIGVGL